jgi:hypothetical protein
MGSHAASKVLAGCLLHGTEARSREDVAPNTCPCHLHCLWEGVKPAPLFLCIGGWLFDPLNLSKDGTKFEELRVKEIKNGRLAMVAWLGFAAQAAVTREGPVQNLLQIVQQ